MNDSESTSSSRSSFAKPRDQQGGAEETLAGFRLLADQGTVAFFDLNLVSGQVHFSRAWETLLGYADNALPSSLHAWRELIHPDDSGASPDRVGKKTPAGTRSFTVEFRLRHQRGHWVWVQCTGVQVLRGPGELERVVGLLLDITERVELAETTVANDNRLQDLSGAGPLAVFELDFAENRFWFSPAWPRLLGEENVGTSNAPVASEDALAAAEAAAGPEAWQLVQSPGTPDFVETATLRHKDGHGVPVLFGAQRTFTRRGELARVVGFACELPGKSLPQPGALPALLTHAAFDLLREAVLVTDVKGKIIFTNATGARLLHLGVEQMLDQNLGEIFKLRNRQTLQPVDDPVERALAAEQPLPLVSDDQLESSVAGGPPAPVVWTARAAFQPDGTAAGVVIVFRNPEEMTLTPEELVRANRFESLGVLAGSIAHDFNNLLTSILGAVSLAKDSRDYTALGLAEEACMTAKGLTKQLLAFAQGSAGPKTVCPPRAIIEDAVKIAAAASSAEITLDVPEDVDPVLVDRGQFLQVFQNLIVNALQAMPPRPHRPRLQIRAANTMLAENQVPGLKEGHYVEMEVRDNGSGIEAEHVGKIFDPFFTTKKHGTGLGLATVLSIVRRHGGQVGLDTQVGVGTAFTIYLPKADRPADVQARRAASLRFGTGRILFMDDDPRITTLTAAMLQSLNYKYDLAKNGEEAIVLYKRYQNIGRPYDAVIMDIAVVGGMGGEECFEELKKLDPDVRAIVASGYDSEETARHFIEIGFCGYLTKPYRVADLGKVLKTVLG